MEPVATPRVFSDRYELTHLIARGGMAQVYRARDRQLDRPVALKVLFPELSVDRAFVERFRGRRKRRPICPTPTSSRSSTGARTAAPTSSSWSSSTAGPSPPSCASPGPLAAQPDRHHRRQRGRRARLRPPPRRGPPRREAGQRAHHRRRPGQGHRLRDRPGHQHRGEPDPDRRRHGHGGLLLARAGRGPRASTPAATSTRSGSCSTRWSTGKPPFTGDSPVAVASKHVRDQPVAAPRSSTRRFPPPSRRSS